MSTGDWFEGSRADGEAVPSLESLFFLEDLLASLPLDSLERGSESVREYWASLKAVRGSREKKDSLPSG